MLTENDVITAVCGELSRRGWETTSTATTGQRGDDIVARRREVTLVVEAKGATRSKEGTSRFGVEFSIGEVRTHVGVAVLRALGVVSSEVACAGLAFPDNLHHRQEVAAVKRALDLLGIAVFWVTPDRGVAVEAREV